MTTKKRRLISRISVKTKNRKNTKKKNNIKKSPNEGNSRKIEK